MHGMNLSLLEYEEIAITRIDKKYRKNEAELMNRAWWDYRTMHPTQRTYLFAGHFSEQFRSLYQRHISHQLSDNIKGYSRPDPLDNRPNKGKRSKLPTPTYLWRARQAADYIRCPYDFYTFHACSIAMRHKTNEAAVGRMKTEDSRKLMLSASNLYEEQVFSLVAEKWKDFQRTSPRFARGEDYIIQEGFSPTPLQLEHEKNLIAHAKRMANPEYLLANAVRKGHVRKAILPLLSKIFGERVIERCKDLCMY